MLHSPSGRHAQEMEMEAATLENGKLYALSVILTGSCDPA
jgi:hypothetical protein